MNGCEYLAGKSVLMVDDEEIVGDVIKEVLLPAVSVLDVVGDGAEALARIVERDYDIILLDIEMPKMSGMEFFRHLKNMKPHLASRTIFITGDTETPSTRSFILKSGCRYLDKPFMIRDLLKTMAGL
ncbi:MAG: response regulator [Deltaproteobacteria bacterium]|nr:response regulator [Deltaproteobacteria bacterium]